MLPGFRSIRGTPDGKALTEAVIPYGLVLLANPIRKESLGDIFSILQIRVWISRLYPVIIRLQYRK